MTKGFGLQLGPGQDSVKVVSSSETCADPPAEGTSEITNLGPSDLQGVSSAQVEISRLMEPHLHCGCRQLWCLDYRDHSISVTES